MRTQFAAVCSLAAALLLMTPTESILLPDTCSNCPYSTSLAAQIASDASLASFTDTDADGHALAQTGAEMSKAEWDDLFTAMHERAGGASKAPTAPFNHIPPSEFKQNEKLFNAANGIDPAKTGGRDYRMVHLEGSFYTTDYPGLKYDGHGYDKPQWESEIEHRGVYKIMKMLKDGTLTPNVDGTTKHIVHIIAGKGQGTIAKYTKELLQSLKLQGQIKDYWADPSDPAAPPSFFVLFEKETEAPKAPPAPVPELNDDKAFPSMGGSSSKAKAKADPKAKPVKSSVDTSVKKDDEQKG